MTEYTLAGPDIGVLRTDLAGLYDRLGEEAGLLAAQQATDVPAEIPGQSPRRVIRHHRDGDEALGWDWFERKLRDRTAATMQPDEPPHEAGPALMENQAATLTFDSAQGLFSQHEDDPDSVRLWAVPVTFTIQTEVTLIARAPDADAAFLAAERYAANAPLPPGTDLRADPLLAVQAAANALAEGGSFEAAGWNLQPDCEVRRIDAASTARILRNFAHEEVRDFARAVRGQAETNVEVLMKLTR